MAEIPRARVVRDGGEGEGTAGGQAAPEGPVLRLAPRAVPRRLVHRLMFGGKIAVFGWAFAAFGMGFVLFFLPMIDLGWERYDRRAVARVTSVEQTSSSENDRYIHRVHYTFADDAGVEHRGESYTMDPPAVLSPHDVAYRSGDPSRSRLSGMRRRPFSPFLSFVLVFPIVGLGIALWQLRAGRRNLHLLRHGVETTGKLIRKAPTNVTVNDVPVMALTFDYEVGGKTYSATMKTLTPAALEDDEREAMLYDPAAPARATTLDHLPGAPKVTNGELLDRPGISAHLLLLPLATAGLLVATVIRMLPS